MSKERPSVTHAEAAAPWIEQERSRERFQQMLDQLDAEYQKHNRAVARDLRSKLLRGRLQKVIAVAAFLSLESQITWREAAEQSLIGKAAPSEHLDVRGLPPLEDMRETLDRDLGPDWEEQLLPLQSADLDQEQRRERIQQERQESRLEVRGFEAIGVDNALVQRYLERGFPRSWTARAEAGVRYTSEHIPMAEAYHIPGFEAGHCTWSAGEEPSEIVITPDAQTSVGVSDLLVSTLPHELAHANDPTNAESMDPRLRLELLYRLDQRVHSESRLRFPYVEAIHNNDPQQERRLRLDEYLAELARAAFSVHYLHPDEPWQDGVARALAISYHAEFDTAREDVSILVRLVEATDLQFDFAASAHAREEDSRAVLAARSEQGYRQAFEKISDPALRAALLRSFALPQEAVNRVFAILEDGRRRQIMLGLTGSRLEMPIADQDTVDRVVRFYVAETQRLESGLPSQAQRPFELWRDVVEALLDARTAHWNHAEGSPGQNVQNSANALNDHLRGLDAQAASEFRSAAERYLRMAAVGEVPLPPAVQAEVESYRPRE